MAQPIIYDVTRLFLGPLLPTPRGIDRVDLAFARHFFADDTREVMGLLPTPWGMRLYDRRRVLDGLARLEALWREGAPRDGDPAWQALRRALIAGKADGPAPDGSPTAADGRAPAPALTPAPAPPNRQRGRQPGAQTLGPLAQAGRMVRLLAATGFAFGRGVVGAAPRNAIYLNVGQIGLALPIFLTWLKHRPDIRPVFMLHDVIPLEAPEFVTVSAAAYHGQMVDATARHAAGLIVTSAAAREPVMAELARRGRPALPTLTQPLPVAAAFRLPSPSLPASLPASRDPALAGLDYFVVCGAIEPRKNHTLLAEVWKRLAQRLGSAAPHLVVVGTHGWTGPIIRHRLERAPSTRALIHVVSGLSTPALVELMAGARALLMPSFAEGFGLPIIEAGALGLPVIASDIAAHREVAPPGTVFLDPLDGPGWEAAIGRRLAAPRDDRPTAAPDALDWPDYFAGLDRFLTDITDPANCTSNRPAN